MNAYFQHHPESFPHPLSLIALIPLSVITMQNKKQKCSFQLKSPTPLIAVSSYFIFSTPISLLIRPRLTLHALQPMDSIRCASTLFCLLHLLHSGNRLPVFSIQINRNGIQFAKNTFCVLQDPSLLLSYHVFIEILHSSY